MDSRIRVTRESAEYFRVRLLGFYGPHAHLDVIITAADLRQWRDKIDEALQEVEQCRCLTLSPAATVSVRSSS